MKTSFTEQKNLFIYSFSYEMDEIDKEYPLLFIATEIINFIPITSFIKYEDLFEKIKYRFTYDKEIKYPKHIDYSNWEISKSLINFLGLGILIFPFRIVATFLKDESDPEYAQLYLKPDINYHNCTLSRKKWDELMKPSFDPKKPSTKIPFNDLRITQNENFTKT